MEGQRLSIDPRFPDFFVVGAPRCGTTSLCRYLARNPQVCFSRPKEPHYFARIDHDPTPEEVRRDYLDRYFAHRTPQHRAAGEGSVSYLYLPHVIERILRLNPQARFITMVRNPLQMLPSYHQRMRFLLQEDVPDFDAAWAAEAARERGERVPGLCLDARLLLYSQVAQLGAQVQRLYGLVGRERAHVVVFDDLVADPLRVYRAALAFIGVDDDGQTTFERRYESTMYRHHWLQKLMFIPATQGGRWVDSFQQRHRKYDPHTGARRQTWVTRLKNWNQRPQAPAPLSAQMRATVCERLVPDVDRLSTLLGRDLRHWLQA